MKGLYVISQKDIIDEPKKEDPIAISSFPIDSHDCQRIALKDGGVINEGTIYPVRSKGSRHGYAYHVPYRSIVPKREQCDNLLVPVALSCTHVGISSLRIEGAWMVIGQGAGIAAALAAAQNVAVQELPYPQLRKRLLAQGHVLELPDVSELPSATGSIAAKTLSGIVLDDSSAKLTGSWSRSTNFKPHIGSGYIFSGKAGDTSKGDGSAAATFRIKAPKSGEYQLLMSYSAHETRATNVPVIVSSGCQKKEFIVDQTQPLPSGQFFKPVGYLQLESGVETIITISNRQTVGFVVVDALQLLPNDQ
jgi:hypothetical protein